MIALRPAETDDDLDAWRRVRVAVLPDERAQTVEEMRTSMTPESLYLLAELDGRVAGAGVAGRSDLAGQGFLSPRILPEARRQGVGTALLRGLAKYLQRLGFDRAGTFVDDPGSLAFAERFGFREVDRDVEQVRTTGDEPWPDDRPDRAENSLSAVRRDWRRRGVASLLKRTVLAWAAANGVQEIDTWTQNGNGAMRAVNERLGYEARSTAICVRGPLPLQR